MCIKINTYFVFGWSFQGEKIFELFSKIGVFDPFRLVVYIGKFYLTFFTCR